MSWFTSESIAVEAPPETPEQRLAGIEQAFQAADGLYREACQDIRRYCETHKVRPQFFLVDDRVMGPVNQQRHPELQRLHSRRLSTLKLRNEEMGALARLKLELKLIR